MEHDLNHWDISAEEIEQGKALAAVAYLGLAGFLVALLTAGENRFVLYHAQQSLVLVFAWMISGFILFLTIIPMLGLIIMFLFWLFIGVPLIVLLIVGITHGAGGVVKPLPVLGRLGLKLGLLKPNEFQ